MTKNEILTLSKTLIYFFRFLKLKKIYSDFFNYVNNYIKERNNETNGNLTMYGRKVDKMIDLLLSLDDYSPQRLISAFPWRNTKEGYAYWSSICDEWGKVFYKIKI
jgi:hypothetical protein